MVDGPGSAPDHSKSAKRVGHTFALRPLRSVSPCPLVSVSPCPLPGASCPVPRPLSLLSSCVIESEQLVIRYSKFGYPLGVRNLVLPSASWSLRFALRLPVSFPLTPHPNPSSWLLPIAVASDTSGNTQPAGPPHDGMKDTLPVPPSNIPPLMKVKADPSDEFTRSV